MTNGSGAANTRARFLASPHHKVSTDGIKSSSPKRYLAAAGKYCFSAGASVTAAPSGFTMPTLPAMAASTSPGTPMNESSRNARGSHQRSKIRLK